MYLSNYHSHCTFCDGRSTMEDFVKFAIAKGLKKYGFSSHAPLPFLTMWTMKEDDFPDYESEFYRLKKKYGTLIELYLGLEVDYIEGYSSVKNEFFRNKKFDYLIGSIHYVDKIPKGRFWNIDGSLDVFDKGVRQIFNGDINAAVSRFFQVSRNMMQLGGIDIVGHIDKIADNARHYSHFNPNSWEYIKQVEETLATAKEHNLIVEINTKAFADKGFTFPHQQHFSFMRSLEIPITVNSDCHYPTNVADSFNPVYQLLKKAGYSSTRQLVNKEWTEMEF